MAVLTDKQQTFLGTVLKTGMPTPGTGLAGEMRVYFNGHTAVAQGFGGNHAVQLSECPLGMDSVGSPLLLARLLALLAFGTLSDVFQVFQANQAMGMTLCDAFGDHMIGVLRSPVSPVR